jgi:hypothetical protein
VEGGQCALEGSTRFRRHALRRVHPGSPTNTPPPPVERGGVRRTNRTITPSADPEEELATILGLDRKTVWRYAHAATPDDASRGAGFRRYGQFHAYSPYRYGRWNEGCTDAARLHAEIVELGLS